MSGEHSVRSDILSSPSSGDTDGKRTVDERAGRGPRSESSGQRTGQRIAHYRLERSLGRGGMGEVFLGWDERLERHVAIKQLRHDRPIAAPQRARFRREARAIARLNHPVIVQIFDLVETERGQHLVMEYVEGTRLDRLLGGGGLPLATALELGAELAEGLAQAHGKGILHRDLKAENVVVTRAGHAKLLDFGVAAMTRAPRTASGEGSGSGSSLTESGMLVGTAYAMSPEQARGGALDHRSDLFALGSVLYAMLTGCAPFRGESLLETLHRVTSQEPAPLETLRRDLPAELRALVTALLAKAPAARPESAEQVARTLRRLWKARDQGAAVLAPGRDLASMSTASAIAPLPLPLREPATAAPEAAPMPPMPPMPSTPRHSRRRAAAAALAALASILIAISSAFAYRERTAGERERAALAEAERRRQEAESLLQFTLADLRGKLQPLGKLAVLDAVGERALTYFKAPPAQRSSDAELLGRAQVLQQLGEVRVSQRKLDEAEPALRESLQLTSLLAARDPARADRQFALAQSHFWLGFLLWQRKQLEPARAQLAAYLRVAEGLVARDPRNRTWMLELAYAHSNLGSLSRELGEVATARSELGAAAGLMETLLAQAPDDDGLRLELAHVQAKLGDILMKGGELAAARPWLTRYLEALTQLVARAPDDAQRLRFLGYAHSHLGNLARQEGDVGGALEHYRADLQIAEKLAAAARDDRALADELALRQDKVADLLIERDELAPAAALLAAERAIVDGLLAHDAASPQWRAADARHQLTEAKLQLRTADEGATVESTADATAAALTRAAAARATLAELATRSPEEQSTAYWRLYAEWRLGALQVRAGDRSAAQATWQRGLELALARQRAERTDEPRLQDLHARLLLALGRGQEAAPILAALDRIGYREPELAAVRGPKTDAAVASSSPR